jgi:hypothetical protein
VRGEDRRQHPNEHKPQALADPHPGKTSLRLAIYMIKNSIRKKEKRKEKQEKMRAAAKFFAGITEIVAVAGDGTQRVLEGDEAVEAIIRQWERDEAER